MKKNILKLTLPCVVALMTLAGCGEEPHEHTYANTWSWNATQHWVDATCEHKGQVCIYLGNHVDGNGDGKCDECGVKMNSDLDPETAAYYSKYNLSLKATKLEKELQKLCFETHTTWWKYSQYYSAASFTSDHISSEAAPETVETSKQNEFFYTGKLGTGVGTREHVWPCANSGSLWVHDGDNSNPHYVDGTNYTGGGSDLYHIRPSTSSVNSARGNSKFCDFDDPEFEGIRDQVISVGDGGPYRLKIQGYDSAKQFATKAEVDDEYKGDVARILVYVWIHYASRSGIDFGDHADAVGNLNLSNVMAYPTIDRVKEKLCEWNRIDPPSETEKLRNNTVQGLQGNRNPFVDYPNLMDQLFL